MHEYSLAVADWRGCQLARWQVGPLNRRQFGPPESVGEKKYLFLYSKLFYSNKIALYPKPMFWGFIAIVIRPAEQRVVEYRPKTHMQLQLPVGTVLRSLSTSFDPPIIYRYFSGMLQPSHKPLGYWNRVALRCKVEPLMSRYSLRFFVGFGSPGKTEGIASLCAERVLFL
ncbi:hypothetical protein AVEN_36143-1 [Araneus ventricosus]|uniref:Uncharacterized protein n=1 Tax=Araneus ventricosus TaxID=182803 RepID=A0A4Y2EIV1_ARAVE|nr:hypothetical protein AVEN_36143-1 [Araneus ventricosus]